MKYLILKAFIAISLLVSGCGVNGELYLEKPSSQEKHNKQ